MNGRVQNGLRCLGRKPKAEITDSKKQAFETEKDSEKETSLEFAITSFIYQDGNQVSSSRFVISKVNDVLLFLGNILWKMNIYQEIPSSQELLLYVVNC